MFKSLRRSASDFCASAMKSLPRWLTSITEARALPHSSISAWARRSTASGSAAGPALKLYARLMESPGSAKHGRSSPSAYPAAVRKRGAGGARISRIAESADSPAHPGARRRVRLPRSNPDYAATQQLSNCVFAGVVAEGQAGVERLFPGVELERRRVQVSLRTGA